MPPRLFLGPSFLVFRLSASSVDEMATLQLTKEWDGSGSFVFSTRQNRSSLGSPYYSMGPSPLNKTGLELFKPMLGYIP